jgi:CRISPR-associated protein Cas2
MASLRFMRLLVFFDLPVETAVDRRNYRVFRNALIKNGFVMLQESVYCRLMTTPSVEKSMRNLIVTNKPEKGIVQILTVTEKQFSKMEYVVGKYVNEVIDSNERMVIL